MHILSIFINDVIIYKINIFFLGEINLLKKRVELLAPAGTWAAFESAISAGADAVYLGGKHFNMRVHKNDFNFDDEELKKAVKYAHERNIKLYITINNLISEYKSKRPK